MSIVKVTRTDANGVVLSEEEIEVKANAKSKNSKKREDNRQDPEGDEKSE